MSLNTSDEVADGRQRNQTFNRQQSHSHLVRFKEAKIEISQIFDEILDYLVDCHTFLQEQIGDDKFKKLIESTHTEVKTKIEKVKNIKEIIARNQMKCAFFGRTSNGKSSVINAMLGTKLLPAGLGHTTSCFLQIEGTDQPTGYLQTASSDNASPKTVPLSQSNSTDSIAQLAHALSGVQLPMDALVKIFWPSSQCRLLREDVVFLDSPGINVDPDMDKWIDSYCLDADVFILVANAESTLMQAEKDFFHKVSQRLSKPNIFIINNRWDASANEIEYVDQIRQQHLDRCVEFLADELNVLPRLSAEEHVFFVSAREVLTFRSKRGSVIQLNTPPGAAPDIGRGMAEGWDTRLEEFTNFEAAFEKNLSESATRTKFAAHCDQGKAIADQFRSDMDKLYETTVEEKDSALRLRSLSQAYLEDVRQRMSRTDRSLDELLDVCLARVEAQVANALNAEIHRLGELVSAYSRTFAPDPALLGSYKKELNSHVERELGRKLVESCSTDILNEVSRFEQVMTNKLATIVKDESTKNRIFQMVDPSSSFSPEFHVDCRNLCADFREDIAFRFSLGLPALYRRFFSSGSSWSFASPPGSGFIGRSALPSSSWALEMFPTLVSRSSVGVVIAFGLVSKTIGWRAIGLVAGLYAGLYAFERLSWTNNAKESAFKRQYVDFASHKLRLIVDLTSTNARHQVKRELHLTKKKLVGEVGQFTKTLADEIEQLDVDVSTLDSLNIESKKLKYQATTLLNKLNKFNDQFITCS